jgi:hypothetical protein
VGVGVGEGVWGRRKMEEGWIRIKVMGGWLLIRMTSLVRRRKIERDGLKLGGRRGYRII